MKSSLLASGAILALLSADAASASTFFGSGADVVLGSPTVTSSGATGTATFGSPAAIFSTTGDLTAANGTGSVAGTLDFSHVTGTVTPDAITAFMTFNDTSGGEFVFDVSTVQTLSYVKTPTSTSITLYLLGTAGDTHLGESFAPTSETLTLNQTGRSAYSASGTIDSPPTGVPEAGSWVIMLIGCGVAGGVVRRARKLSVS